MFQLSELIRKSRGIVLICQHKPSWVGEKIPIIKKYKRRALIRYKGPSLLRLHRKIKNLMRCLFA